MTAPRDPHEEKVRDYLHQRQNVYGENDKSSRKAIRLRKRWSSKAARREAREHLGSATDGDGVDDGAPVKRSWWRKVPDKSLADTIHHGAEDEDPSAALHEARRRSRRRR